MSDWEHWRTALEIYRCGTLREAASLLEVNPTTVRRRLEQLETALDRKLFSKTDGRLKPTAAMEDAIILIENAAANLRTAENLVSSERVLASRRKFIVTSVPIICEAILFPALNRLPEIGKTRVELVAANRNLDLRKGEADLALRLGPGQSDSANRLHLGEMSYSTYRHESAPSNDIPWVTVDRASINLQEVRLPEKFAGPEAIRFTGNSIAAIAAAVSSGAAKGLVPDFLVQKRADLICLKDHPRLERNVWATWRSGFFETPNAREIFAWMIDEIGRYISLTVEAKKFRDKLGPKSPIQEASIQEH